ncbi:MAG: nodulation protein NfeD, partial [Chloroflexota bacterium]|nr:nodulation protein NfeD [Chloroflexota bacterium]
YIDRGITDAENSSATAVVIELNTPGGVLTSTEKIVERIMNAEVPVIVYVTPKGAGAASAGVFITLSGHVAAMAGGTTIGAAHPVTLGASGQESSEVMEEKITEYAATWIRGIAEQRGRNAEWAESAVRRSASLTDNEALEQNVIDIRADTIASLLAQMDGMKIEVAGREIVLETKDSRVQENGMSFIERFLHAISDPNIAYILLSVGSLGIILELYNPGSIFPGVAGAISLLMAFYSLSVLNAYWAGILLIVLAFALFVAEVFTANFGLLTAGGIASLVTGSLLLFSGGPSMFGLDIDWWLIVVVVIGIVAFFTFVIQAVVRTQRQKQPTAADGLIGMEAEVKTTLNPKGTVSIHGELWEAIMDDGEAGPGEEVIVTEVKGLRLRVSKKK